MKTLVYLVGLLVLAGAKPNERPRVFCGRALAEARIWYCFGPDVPTDVKRNYHDAVWTVHKRTLTWPLLAKRIHKRDSGLVDECCLNPCYVNQLLRYC